MDEVTGWMHVGDGAEGFLVEVLLYSSRLLLALGTGSNHSALSLPLFKGRIQYNFSPSPLSSNSSHPPSLISIVNQINQTPPPPPPRTELNTLVYDLIAEDLWRELT